MNQIFGNKIKYNILLFEKVERFRQKTWFWIYLIGYNILWVMLDNIYIKVNLLENDLNL